MEGRLKNVIILNRLNESSDIRFLSAALGQGQIIGNWRIRIAWGASEFCQLLDGNDFGTADGIITTAIEDPEIATILDGTSTPTVVVGSHNDNLATRTKALSYVMLDEELIGTTAAEYIGGLGRFNSYAYIHAPDPSAQRWSGLRCSGYTKALRKMGFRVHVFRGSGNDLAAFLAALPKPTAVLAAYDKCAAAVISACHETRTPIPSQIMVLGVDNNENICLTAHPKISSLAIGSSDEGFEAVKELSRLMSAPQRFRKPRLQVCRCLINVVERGSTSLQKPSARLVDAAKSFVSAHVAVPLKVPDVVEALWTSRRLLEMRFREVVGESVARYILRARMEHLAARLLASKASAARILRQCGFENISHASVAFKRQYGMTIGEYRARASGERP